MSTVIKIEDLAKKYMIGRQTPERYTALRDVMVHQFKSCYERVCHPFSSRKTQISLEEFWALKDINIEIKQGDRLGVIGRNGAGKSTLLKVLSRITEPTKGTISIRGRVASLLEVGTGFHPELTGRENIFLNGAILGMSRLEIKKNFDEIVDFAEVGKFLNTPVKRYSSGMYVRLAFSVAAHLEPEILIVDEVLAVGDFKFQEKCLGKMENIGKEGRTVIFVSHNMAAIEALCDRVLLLSDGKNMKDGTSNSVINEYLSGGDVGNVDLSHMKRKGLFGAYLRFTQGYCVDCDNQPVTHYRIGEKIVFHFELFSEEGDHDDLHVNIGINTSHNQIVTTVTNRTSFGLINCPHKKTVSLKVEINDLILAPGAYNLTLAIGRRGQAPLDILQSILPFSVDDTLASSQVVNHPNLPGIVQANSTWVVQTDNGLAV